jgi:hypothetical protein
MQARLQRSLEPGLVMPRALEEKIGVLGMKCFGDNIILKSGAVQPMDCLRYSLSAPALVLCCRLW